MRCNDLNQRRSAPAQTRPRGQRTLRRVNSLARLALVLLLTLAFACDEPPEQSTTETDLGPIEATLDAVTKTVWPGNTRADGSRYIRLLNGFFDGKPSAYWFAGFASRKTADVFWFCAEGDTQCPFDDTGTLDRNRTIGDPIFARIPGEDGYSPFWLVWVVRVPEGYQPNEIKSVLGVERAAQAGRVRVERHIADHGGMVGPDETIMHCLLVLSGTELEGNGDEALDEPGVATVIVPPETGWHKQYRVTFYDFTANEGVFPPDPTTESRPLMPTADIFVFFRDCGGGSTSPLCEWATAPLVAVSERGVEQDFTGDGDKRDNNNIISGFPRTDAPHELDRVYSPLWRVNVVRVIPEFDAEVELITVGSGQEDTEIRRPADIRNLVADGKVAEPVHMSEELAGNMIPGNDGKVFFNCPSQVAVKP